MYDQVARVPVGATATGMGIGMGASLSSWTVGRISPSPKCVGSNFSEKSSVGAEGARIGSAGGSVVDPDACETLVETAINSDRDVGMAIS